MFYVKYIFLVLLVSSCASEQDTILSYMDDHTATKIIVGKDPQLTLLFEDESDVSNAHIDDMYWVLNQYCTTVLPKADRLKKVWVYVPKDKASLKGSAIKLASIYQKNLSFNFNIIFGKINNKAIHPTTKVMGFLTGRS